MRKVSPVNLVLGAVGLGLGVAGVLALREATLSTHEEVPPGSTTAVRFEAATRNGERGQTLDEMVSALVLTCRLEVSSDVVGEVEELGDDRYRAVLHPALDQTNRRQFRGCVEDWTIDQLQTDELSFADGPPEDRLRS
jgi:beta-galactosidase GanA